MPDGGWGGMSYGDWAKLIASGYGAYQSSKDKGKWEQLPEDPSRIALRAQILGYMQPGKSPTRNMLGGLLGPRVEQLGQNAPKGMPVPKYDLSAILGNIEGATPGTVKPSGVNFGGQNFNTGPKGMQFGGGGIGPDVNRVQHRTQDSGDRPMGVMEEIESMSRGMFNDPLNAVHAGNATGDPNWTPTPWPAGTGPNKEKPPVTNPVPPEWKPEDANGQTPPGIWEQIKDGIQEFGPDAARAVLYFLQYGPMGALGSLGKSVYDRYRAAHPELPANPGGAGSVQTAPGQTWTP